MNLRIKKKFEKELATYIMYFKLADRNQVDYYYQL